jgi:hypothetical protein
MVIFDVLFAYKAEAVCKAERNPTQGHSAVNPQFVEFPHNV